MIRVENLKKSYGDVQALRGIDFQVQEGEVVGLLGPNGAGKTTAIKILTGYLHPDEGHVAIDGLDVLENTLKVQARIGYLPENTPLYGDLSVQGYLKLMANLRRIPKDDHGELLADAILATGLADYRTRPIHTLSKGLRQRVGLAQAILHQPKLLILDEPTVGLDPTQIIEIRHLIRRLSEHTTILFSSHILSEVQAVCDRVIILINGNVRADAHLNELEATSDAVLVLQKDTSKVEKHLGKLKGVVGIEASRTFDGYPTYRVLVEERVDIFPQLYALARERDWPVRELRREVLTLEAVFTQLASSAFEPEDEEDEMEAVAE